MRLVAFSAQDLNFMVMGLYQQAERQRPTAGLKNMTARAYRQREHEEYTALGHKIHDVLHQAEAAVATAIAITGQQPPPVPQNEKPEPPRLVTLSIAELRMLWFALGTEAGRLDAELQKQVRSRRKTKEELGYIRGKRQEVRACRKLLDRIDRLYNSARKNTAVRVAVE